MIQATFSFHAGFNPESRLFNNALGGGGILDVGCYCASHGAPDRRRRAGQGLRRADRGEGHAGTWARPASTSTPSPSLKFPGDIVAQLATGVGVSQENVVRIFGTEGNILVPTPWIPGREGGVSQDHRQAEQGQGAAGDRRRDQRLALRHRGRHRGAPTSTAARRRSPAMTWDDTLGNMKTLDAWRAVDRPRLRRGEARGAGPDGAPPAAGGPQGRRR